MLPPVRRYAAGHLASTAVVAQNGRVRRAVCGRSQLTGLMAQCGSACRAYCEVALNYSFIRGVWLASRLMSRYRISVR